MVQLSKIFHFEMAHAIHGYAGACSSIHGHSYTLQVTVSAGESGDDFIPAPGFIIDFRELKRIVTEKIICQLDHKLLLSRAFIEAGVALPRSSLVIWEHEPTAENLLHFIQRELSGALPTGILLEQLKLFETPDSYATWVR